MKAGDFIPLLGRTSDDPKVKAFLAEYGITKEPKLKSGLFDGIVKNQKQGIEITFTDERHLDVPSDEYEDGALVLSNIRFYAEGDESFKAYTGELPLGLKFMLDRKSSQTLLGKKPTLESKELGKARWDFDGYCVFLTYNMRFTEILVVEIQLPVE